MLCLKTFLYLHRPIAPLQSLRCRIPRPQVSVPQLSTVSFPSAITNKSRLTLSAASATTMSTTAAANFTTVEHVVLFQVKPDTDPSRVDAMLSNLRALVSLDHVSHLTAAPILRSRSSAASPFTHLLHSRYPSKADLSAYSDQPDHRSVVKDFVLPICDDIMAVDWVASLNSGPLVLPPGSAARLTFVKLKEGTGEGEKEDVLSVISGIQDSVKGVEIQQVSFGENFSPGRAKGYSLAVLAVFPGVEELDALDGIASTLEAQKEKVRPYIESVIVLDFTVPSSPSASL